MADLSKEAKAIQKKYIPYGARIASLAHELHHIGAHEAARFVAKAGDVFYSDVERLEKLNDQRN